MTIARQRGPLTASVGRTSNALALAADRDPVTGIIEIVDAIKDCRPRVPSLATLEIPGSDDPRADFRAERLPNGRVGQPANSIKGPAVGVRVPECASEAGDEYVADVGAACGDLKFEVKDRIVHDQVDSEL